jgi:ATP-dependent DNA helicase RecQ
VIHIDVPYSPEAYLQETGRAGRDGRPVEATLMYSQEDLDFADSFGKQGLPGTDFPAEHAAQLAEERYAQMLGYALDKERCCRKQLLGFLGQELASWRGCDVCDGKVVDIPEGQRSILEVVSRLRRRFTLHQTVQLLRGAKSYEEMRAGLASYPVFGSLNGWQEEEIEEALDSLVKAGKMKVLTRGFWKHRVTRGEAFPWTPRS